MRDSNQLLDKANRAISQPSNASPIAAGPQGSDPSRQPITEQLIDAINRVFAELELAYHNQYHKAYPANEQVMLAKQLWADALRRYSPEVIVRGCRAAIRESQFLPNLHVLDKCCREQLGALGLPDAHDAYREACFAKRPKCNHDWSHPAVYFAGKACDWRRLAGETEARMLPLFEKYYLEYCEQVLAGVELSVPHQPLLDGNAGGPPLEGEEKHGRMEDLRKDLGI